MKEFPKKLIPENKSRFPEFLFSRNLAKLRGEIYEYMLEGKDTGFEIPTGTDPKLIEKIKKELKTLGWKTKIAYAGTTLFIYQKGEEPKIPEGLKEFF